MKQQKVRLNLDASLTLHVANRKHMGRYSRYFISCPQHALLRIKQKAYEDNYIRKKKSRAMFDKIHFTNVGQIN